MTTAPLPLPVPDEPRWVEAHDLAATPGSWRRALGTGGGGCIGTSEGAAPLACVWGPASVDAVVELAAEHPQHTLLVERERADVVAGLRAAGRVVVRALLHTLPDPHALPDLDGAAPLPADASLAHLPDELRAELEDARAWATIWSAWVDGEPVSFAYAAATSERWFDIGVDTAPGARQLGLATVVAAAMIRAERAEGREPVWGATEDNVASLRLAHRLGFRAIDEVWVVAPVGAS